MSTIQDQLEEGCPLLFVHIPKTAGTSVTDFISRQFAVNEICPSQVLYELKLSTKENSSNPTSLNFEKYELWKYRLIADHLQYGFYKVLPHQPICITFLRDPIDRVISQYQHFKRVPAELLKQLPNADPQLERAIKIAQEGSIHDFICSPQSCVQKYIRNVQTQYIANDQVAEFEFDNSFSEHELIKSAKSHLERFAFVGLTEKFDDSIKLLCYLFGWSVPDSWQPLNVTPSKIHKEDLPSQTLHAIKERTQLDQQLYDYGCELFARRYEQMIRDLLHKHYLEVNPGIDDSRLLSVAIMHISASSLLNLNRMLLSLHTNFSKAINNFRLFS